jgi:formylglycine-generating enzyme required for sulfatase activity
MMKSIRRLLPILCLLSLPALAAEPDGPVAFCAIDSFHANTFAFAPAKAQFVRIAILKSSSGEPCIDELEIYGPDSSRNLALKAAGAVASASSSLTGYDRHRIEWLNDGQYTNGHSWICGKPTGWCQIRLPEPVTVNRIVVSRDRGGDLSDRRPEDFDIQVSADGEAWTTARKVRSPAQGGASALVIPEFFQKKATLAESLIASRAAWQQVTGTGKLVARSSWQMSPASACDTLATPLPQDKMAVPEGAATWPAHPEWADGIPVPLNLPNRSAVYLYRTITVPQAVAVTMDFGSDDAIMVRLNGESVLVHDKVGSVRPGEDHLSLDLAAGTNHLVVKLWNISDIAGFCYADNLQMAGRQCRNQLEAAFPEEMAKLNRRAPGFVDDFLTAAETAAVARRAVAGMFPKGSALSTEPLKQIEAAGTDPVKQIGAVLVATELPAELEMLSEQLPLFSSEALLKAIDARGATLAGAAEKRAFAAGLKDRLPGIAAGLKAGNPESVSAARAAIAFRKELLLSDPAVDFDKLLFIRRAEAPSSMIKGGYHDEWGLPVNFCGSSCINPTGWKDELVEFSLRDGSSKILYKPAKPAIIGDLELNFNADRMMFASADAHSRWQIFELKADGTGLRQVSPSAPENDIDNYDPLYLPDGKVIFNSSATFAGVPCFGGTDYVANLHVMNADGSNIRRLTYEQDNDWHPTMLPNGRVLYLRWEYTDSAHYFSRILMHMNPDGTNQTEFYGSNSYWPNTMFYPKPLPGSSTKFVAVVSGHHGTCRAGELFLFDIAKGRQETAGVLQRVAPPAATPSCEGEIKDYLVDRCWPKFLQPQPLSDKLFVVTAMLRPGGAWGVYLIDIHGNLALLAEDADGRGLFEPIPLKKQPVPPVIPDKVDLKDKQAHFFIQDIYEGEGLRGVPRGSVKSLRIFQYEYSYRDMGGHYRIGMEGPWDVRRLIGTVPVFADGSATFKAPANTPIAIQPLDAEGKALQQMRSWTLGMPGEQVHCVGCHERQNVTLAPKKTIAASHEALTITPWHGQKRGFSFTREVQPVLDKYCVSCHNGAKPGLPDFKNQKIVGQDSQLTGFPQSYMALHPYVRRNGPEGVYYTLTPLEFHADTSELVQMLKKGHHGVRLDPEGWDRLITWIDLNVPCYGTWAETQLVPRDYVKRRLEMKQKYAAVDEDVEAMLRGDPYDATPVAPQAEPAAAKPPQAPSGWPFDAAEAAKRQAALGKTTMTVDLGNGRQLSFVRIPAGEFVMGSATGANDERPQAVVKIAKPFWIATTEVALADYQAFDPRHKNGFYDQHYKDQVRPGYTMDKPDFPVIRVSWQEAMAFCTWLGDKSGKKATLPTEAQWEWACRAGTATPLSFGAVDADFGKLANLADLQLRKMAVIGVDPQPIANPNQYWDFIPKIVSVDDGSMLLAPVGSYEPNPWGLRNMHGNVAEWCLDTWRPYPYNPKAAAKDAKDAGPLTRKVIRGGSWNDRPFRATSSYRLDFPAWQKPYNTGFRPVIEEE